MKIIAVPNPAFLWNDKPYVVETQKISNDNKNPFIEMSKIFSQKKLEGMTHCFIYRISDTNSELAEDFVEYNPNLPFFVRWTFQKIPLTKEVKIKGQLKYIEKILHGKNIEPIKNIENFLKGLKTK